MSMPIVAIIGRPNVGKSTLFNKIVGKRVSIVDDFPGVTRDRIYAEGEWAGAKFNLIDTGGLEDGGGFIFEQVKSQAEFAMSDADVIIFVVDIKSGVHSSDLEISNMLKKNKKPVVLCVNKCDSVGDVPAELYEAAKIDGANPVQIYFKITLPYIMFIMGPYIITQFTGNINNFNVIYLLSGGAPQPIGQTAGKTDLLVTWLYKLTIDYKYYNIGAVIGILTFIVLSIVALVTYRNTASYKDEEGFQ